MLKIHRLITEKKCREIVVLTNMENLTCQCQIHVHGIAVGSLAQLDCHPESDYSLHLSLKLCRHPDSRRNTLS
jgi:hypothetical protein